MIAGPFRLFRLVVGYSFFKKVESGIGTGKCVGLASGYHERDNLLFKRDTAETTIAIV